MGQFIVELKPQRYIIWSTEWGTAITPLMTYDQLKNRIVSEAIYKAESQLEQQMQVVSEKGHSVKYSIGGDTIHDLIVPCNRVGPNETKLPSVESITDYIETHGDFRSRQQLNRTNHDQNKSN